MAKYFVGLTGGSAYGRMYYDCEVFNKDDLLRKIDTNATVTCIFKLEQREHVNRSYLFLVMAQNSPINIHTFNVSGNSTKLDRAEIEEIESHIKKQGYVNVSVVSIIPLYDL